MAHVELHSKVSGRESQRGPGISLEAEGGVPRISQIHSCWI